MKLDKYEKLFAQLDELNRKFISIISHYCRSIIWGRLADCHFNDRTWNKADGRDWFAVKCKPTDTICNRHLLPWSQLSFARDNVDDDEVSVCYLQLESYLFRRSAISITLDRLESRDPHKSRATERYELCDSIGSTCVANTDGLTTTSKSYDANVFVTRQLAGHKQQYTASSLEV